jgi:hypothetical protein
MIGAVLKSKGLLKGLSLGFLFTSTLVLGLNTVSAQAPLSDIESDGAYLDRPYTDIVKPILMKKNAERNTSRNDVLKVINMQTSVKSQAKRGTCSIFSAAALLESMLRIKQNYASDVDFSEEYIQYLAMLPLSQNGGSTSTANFRNILRYGAPKEATLPYIGVEWKTIEDDALAEQRCGSLIENEQMLTTCLLAHRDPRLMNQSDKELNTLGSAFYDPEFSVARKEAMSLQKTLFATNSNWFNVSSQFQIRQLLNQGLPLTLDIDFYYGAWNHRKATDLGIPRNMDHWERGLVGNPEPGSVDKEMSETDPAGHSVLIVGYDDDFEIKVDQLMTDGTTQTFAYKGVYFFKNSWGTGSFGSKAVIDGKLQPGYGAITQKYAHDYGGFYRLPLQ